MSDIRNLRWWKSSRSGNQGQCVEVASAGGAWYVRDSKDPGGAHLTVGSTAWLAFLDAVARPRR